MSEGNAELGCAESGRLSPVAGRAAGPFDDYLRRSADQLEWSAGYLRFAAGHRSLQASTYRFLYRDDDPRYKCSADPRRVQEWCYINLRPLNHNPLRALVSRRAIRDMVEL
jgi:hypothetical protein